MHARSFGVLSCNCTVVRLLYGTHTYSAKKLLSYTILWQPYARRERIWAKIVPAINAASMQLAPAFDAFKLFACQRFSRGSLGLEDFLVLVQEEARSTYVEGGLVAVRSANWGLKESSEYSFRYHGTHTAFINAALRFSSS